jgi:glycerophosphoryl diester phosphodiesterase
MRDALFSHPRPIAIAHRAANDLKTLRIAAEIGADLAEGDVWLYRGRLEVRHLKTMGRVPILWDRWRLATRWTWGLELPDVLEALPPDRGVMLDLKGTDRRLPSELIETLRRYGGTRIVAVSSRNWDILEPFRDMPEVAVIHSVGSGRQLRTVAERLTWGRQHAVAIHRRLLTPAVLRALKERAPLVVSWPVNRDDHARQLLDWGVDGVITDDFGLLRRLVESR